MKLLWKLRGIYFLGILEEVKKRKKERKKERKKKSALCQDPVCPSSLI
jgi:hypothetical protein